MNDQLENALDYCLGIVEQNMAEPTCFPERWEDKGWVLSEKNRISSHWVDGFWTGQLWLAYAYTEDPKFECWDYNTLDIPNTHRLMNHPLVYGDYYFFETDTTHTT